MQVTFYRDKVRTIVRTFDNIIIRAFCGSEDDILDEEMEICQALTNKIIESICDRCLLEDIIKILEIGGSAYECFNINFSIGQAQKIATQLWKYKDDILKYLRLAKQEESAYPEKEIKRLRRIKDESDKYLEYADK